MESSIMKVWYGDLQAAKEKAKEDLKGVEENIKKIIGRDPNEGPPPRIVTTRGRQEDSWTGRGAAEVVRPSVKKRLGDPKTVFSRLSGPRYRHDENNSGDEDSTPNKGNREQKKAQVEKQLEEAAKREKDELKRERQELFQNRKRRQAEIRNIELKMARIQEQENWENLQKPLLNFIQTRSKPHLFYLPKTHNAKTEERLASSQKSITKMIEKKRKDVQEEVAAILKRGMGPQLSSVVNAGGEAKSADDPEMDYEDDDVEDDEDVEDEEMDDDLDHQEEMNVDLGDKENIAVLPV
ncbi:hypothetical protein LSTR_LSTR009017 [Laodelphax striatellus]|uniref:Pinin/SDK/MemA protein domain-containing protein n=1 Tax=Laodelphax striatellus TaxID=195883 RepID=A0A482XC03_LAOST|nr:hypothetical protein LSTR_LSTR009017 [Laodelphax striatellus]